MKSIQIDCHDAEQSVGSIYNYALKRAETHTNFLNDETERNHYTNDISELGKSIAENTRGAMAVYLRYNPEDYGATSGFWYTIKLEDGSWQSSVPTDMSLISYIIPYYYDDYTVGIMGMDIDMSVLREAVSDISLYESGGAFLMARDGNLIYHVKYKDGVESDRLPDEEKAYFDQILSLEKNTINRYDSITGEPQKLILKELRNGMILGIYAPENIDKLFQTFGRIAEKKNRNIEGTGLGLNIEAHYAERAKDFAYANRCVIPDVKVLLVDDNSMNRKVFVGLLKKLACAIDQADCVNAKTPVIILTANAVAGAREKYLEEGFDNFLSKPVSPDKLERILLDIVPEYKIFPADTQG